MNVGGGLVTAVAPGSFGQRVGLRVGDRLLSINGHRLRDVIDFQFFGAEEALSLAVQRDGQEIVLRSERAYDEPWGVEFAEPLFDGIRTCANRCPFCFVTGLPKGLRRSLYVRDDDYRLSFLYGNFVTLTNLTEEDWERIAGQRLSPLHVSVQATDPGVRRQLLGGQAVPDVRDQILRLGDAGITVEAQVVICPGLNDGPVLERTVSDLWELEETVESVALVPVGLTRQHPGGLRPLTPEEARQTLAFAEGWRRRAYRATGRRFVYPADELYLLAGEPFPGARTYDGFPQLANGVGLVRRFLDEWRRVEARLAARAPQAAVQSATLVTGRAFLTFLETVAAGLAGALGIHCVATGVGNRLFGEGVTVAGLLAAQDVVAALQGQDLGDLVVLPRSMFDAAGERTLDDWSPDRIAQALACRVAMAEGPADLLAALTV